MNLRHSLKAINLDFYLKKKKNIISNIYVIYVVFKVDHTINTTVIHHKSSYNTGVTKINYHQ